MPSRNLYALLLIAGVSLACYQRADSANRSRQQPMFDTFSEVLGEIDRHYVEPVDQRELFEGALEGMVDRLDPYSSYLGPQKAAESRQSLDQEFGGVGLEVGVDRETKALTVLSPIPGTPAYQAGVLAGDKILQVDGESTDSFSLEDLVHRLRGAAGTKVLLTVLHEGASQPADVELVRAVIQVETVLGFTRNADGSWNYWLPGGDRVAYVRISNFAKKTDDELRDVLARLAETQPRGLILDLRNNSGGLLQVAVSVVDMLLPEGRIVSTVGRGGVELERFDATGQAAYDRWPLAVLINQYSASASEIVAAALADHHRAAIVGQRSFGKGTVQSAIPIEQGRSELRLTIATYWRPSGQNIHRSRAAKPADAWGVLPDKGLEVSLNDAQFAETLGRQRKREAVRSGDAPFERDMQAEVTADLQLAKALEHLGASLRASVAP